MNKKVLFYNFNDRENMLLTASLSPLGAQLVFVQQEDHARPVGALLGLPIDASRDSISGSIGGKMLVMSGFSQDDVQLLLSLMRDSGFGRDVLKAVATPANIAWSAAKLWNELSFEHAQMNGNRK